MVFEKVGLKGAWRIEDDKVVLSKGMGDKTFFIGIIEDLANDTHSSCITFSYLGKQIKLFYKNTEDVREKAKEAYEYMSSFIQEKEAAKNSSDKMYVEFFVDTETAPWILTNDKIIIKKLGGDKEYIIAEIHKLNNFVTGKHPYIEFTYGESTLHKLLYYKPDEIVKATDAFKYMKTVIQKKEEEIKKLEQLSPEELLEYKVSQYKKEKTKVYDEELEKIKNEYYSYIYDYLSSLPKEEEYIVSSVSLEDIRNSHEKLIQFQDFDRLVEYLCANRILFKKDTLLGQTKYRLRESIEKEAEFENELIAVAIYGAMNRKEEEYCRGCNDDKEILELLKEYSIAYNAYARSVLELPMQSKIPMSPQTAMAVGTIAGGLTYGALAAMEANANMEKYKANQNYYIQKKVEEEVAKIKVERCFYKLQNALYEYGDVYDDWTKTKEEVIKSKALDEK